MKLGNYVSLRIGLDPKLHKNTRKHAVFFIYFNHESFSLYKCICRLNMSFFVWQVYGAINFSSINLLLQKMVQFYGAITLHHFMAPFYGACVLGLSVHFYMLYLTVCESVPVSMQSYMF